MEGCAGKRHVGTYLLSQAATMFRKLTSIYIDIHECSSICDLGEGVREGIQSPNF
jgi:hypothetical protein